MRKHFIPEYFAYPEHPITINLVGAGGTGSHVLYALGCIHYSLRQLNHPGLHVTVIDGDTVSPFNPGRQRFSPADAYGKAFKSSVLVSRVNGYFGTNWTDIPHMMEKDNKALDNEFRSCNILLSCVDSGSARQQVFDYALSKKVNSQWDPDRTSYYWMDFGNSRHTGQVVLGTMRTIEQPKRKRGVSYLKTVDEMFPEIMQDNDKDKDETSCSMREALLKQDLFINQQLANWGAHMLWQLFTESSITQQGYFLNMKTGRTMPIPINI